MTAKLRNRTVFQLIVLVLILACLPGCETLSSRDASQESALAALRTAVKKDLRTRTLPNGKEYCAELAKTEQEQDNCTGDLEDGFYLSNRDKERAAKTLDSGIERINRATRKCPWYKPGCNK